MSLIPRTLRPVPPVRVARIGELAVVHSIESFTFTSGHPLRAANCMFCHMIIGGDQVAIIGLAGLAGDACDCGAIIGDVYLIHAAHFPVDPDKITVALRRAHSCTQYHPVHR